MKDFAWKIKVSDILLNPWSKDEIEFKNKHTKIINNITDEWIQWKILIEWLDDRTILITLLDLEVNLNEICEISWEKFILEIKVDKYDMKFLTYKDEDLLDEVWKIELKDMLADIEEMVTQAIILNKPLIIKSPSTIKNEKLINNEDKEDESIKDSVSKNTINWIYKNK